MRKQDDSESEVKFEVAEGGFGGKEDMLVEGIDRRVKVVVEKVHCFGVEGTTRGLEDRMLRGRRVALMERSK